MEPTNPPTPITPTQAAPTPAADIALLQKKSSRIIRWQVILTIIPLLIIFVAMPAMIRAFEIAFIAFIPFLAGIILADFILLIIKIAQGFRLHKKLKLLGIPNKKLYASTVAVLLIVILWIGGGVIRFQIQKMNYANSPESAEYEAYLKSEKLYVENVAEFKTRCATMKGVFSENKEQKGYNTNKGVWEYQVNCDAGEKTYWALVEPETTAVTTSDNTKIQSAAIKLHSKYSTWPIEQCSYQGKQVLKIDTRPVDGPVMVFNDDAVEIGHVTSGFGGNVQSTIDLDKVTNCKAI